MGTSPDQEQRAPSSSEKPSETLHPKLPWSQVTYVTPIETANEKNGKVLFLASTAEEPLTLAAALPAKGGSQGQFHVQ